MNINNNKIKMILLGVSFLFLTKASSQTDSLQGNHYFKIYLSEINYARLELKTQGVELLTTTFSPSFEFGLEYAKYTKNLWGYQMGANISLIGISYFYYFYSDWIVNSKRVSFFHGFDRTNYLSSRLTLNFSGFKDFVISKNNLLHTQIGFNANFNTLMSSSGGQLYRDNSGNVTRFFNMELNSIADEPVPIALSPSFLGKVGVVTILKNKNQFTVSLVGSFHPTPIYIGYYYFNTLEYESKGIAKFKPSYFGVEFNYAFYRGNRFINKAKRLKKKSKKKKRKTIYY